MKSFSFCLRPSRFGCCEVAWKHAPTLCTDGPAYVPQKVGGVAGAPRLERSRAQHECSNSDQEPGSRKRKVRIPANAERESNCAQEEHNESCGCCDSNPGQSEANEQAKSPGRFQRSKHEQLRIRKLQLPHTVKNPIDSPEIIARRATPGSGGSQFRTKRDKIADIQVIADPWRLHKMKLAVLEENAGVRLSSVNISL